MTNIDILTACIASREGDMVANQFRDWANGEDFENQNRFAMKSCLLVLQHIARGSSGMALEAQEWADRINEALA